MLPVRCAPCQGQVLISRIPTVKAGSNCNRHLDSSGLRHSSCHPLLNGVSPAQRWKFVCLSALPCKQISSFVQQIMYSETMKRSARCNASVEQEAEETKSESSIERVSELMIVSDLDFTMVDHNDKSHAALLNFNCLWAAEYSHKSLLVYSTGRSPERYLKLREEVPLLTPAIVILSVGTEILFGQSLEPDAGWERALDDGWNRDIIVEEARKIAGLHFQEDLDQRPHKVSFKLGKKHAQEIQSQLSTKLQERGLKVKLIYSGGIDLDVLPYKAGKGEALAYLIIKMKMEGWPAKNVLVCGDSGNDTELFTVEGVKGVIVSNAHEDLVQWYQLHGAKLNVFYANQRCAGGIIQALEHFGLGPHLSPRDRINAHYVPSLTGNGSLVAHGSAQREVIEFNIFFEKWLNGEVPNREETFRRLIEVIASGATMVYPWGIESSLAESLCGMQYKHGAMQGKGFVTWFDNIKEQKLAEGVYLVTWQPWEQLAGGTRKGYFATAIFLAKAGTPNGVVWLRFHETLRKND